MEIKGTYQEVSKQRYLRAVTNKNKYINILNCSVGKLSQPRQNYKERIDLIQSTKLGTNISLLKETHHLEKNPGDIWEIANQANSAKHYAMWPEKLVERMIKCSTKEGDTILDPFAGSGTTIKKAIELNRKAIGFDLGYHDISKKKLSNIQKRLIIS